MPYHIAKIDQEFGRLKIQNAELLKATLWQIAFLNTVSHEADKGGETTALVEPQTNQSPLMLLVTLLRHSCAGLAGLTLLLCGEATQVQAGAC